MRITGEPVTDEPGGWATGLAPGDDLLRLATAWTIGLDTMARAAVAAVTTAAETQLRSTMAEALGGKVPGWGLGDFLPTPPPPAGAAPGPHPAPAEAAGQRRA